MEEHIALVLNLVLRALRTHKCTNVPLVADSRLDLDISHDFS